MDKKKYIKFDDIGIEECKFNRRNSPILINETDINEIVVSNNLPFSKQDSRYFIGYKDNKKLDLHAYYFQK